MPITLGLNIASLSARRQLGKSSRELTKTFERLSSGQRINRSSDDAAGLAIANALRSDSRVFDQAVRNVNDGISLLNIAESAVENLSGIVIRLKELAQQAANGSLGYAQRGSLDDEAQALKEEYFRIAKSTSFNDQNIFEADFGTLNLQAGFGADGVIGQGLGGAIGDGTLGNANSFSFGSADFQYTTGDFDGDGNVDIVATDTTDDVLYMLLGNGSGGFTESGSFSAGGAYPTGVTSGDFNGDGLLDAAVIDRATGEIGVLLGNGDGTFQTPSTYSVVTNSFALWSADFNGDGADDLVTNAVSGDAFYVLLNEGDGTFGNATSFSASNLGSGSDLAIGDYNEDGITDLVFSSATDETIQVFEGAGDETFTSTLTISLSEVPDSIVTDDFDGDGHLDFVVSQPLGQFATLYSGDGSGGFNNGTAFSVGVEPRGLAAGDLNGDGSPDLVFSDGTDNSVILLLNDGDGTFTSSATVSVTSGGNQVFLEDFNNDGVLDVGTKSSEFEVLLSNTTDGVAPLLEFSLESITGAKSALSQFTHKLEQLSQQRGEIGAFESRLLAAKNVLYASSENFKAADSQIRDADIAPESANLTRLQILQQASTTVLAQANQQPAIAISLLNAP